MKTRLLAWVAALFCCLSCIDTNTTLGGNFVPAAETYTFYTTEFPIEDISMQMADNLSGFSDSRITIGAIRDQEFGLTTRASAFSLVPLFMNDFNIGKNPVFQSFHFAAARDTLSVPAGDQQNILQKVRVYELASALDSETDADCNKPLAHLSRTISRGTPVYGGTDSLSFNFSEEFGTKYLQITADDVKDMKTYLSRFPGIYLEVDEPDGEGGRINMLDLQMGYDKQNKIVTGNIATLFYSAEFDGVRKDTTLNFYFGAPEFFDLDSLFKAYGTNGNTGTFPQYALNLTGHDTRDRTGKATDKIWIEGGGGLKPVIPARSLKRQVEEAIAAVGGDPRDAVINKASLVFPFEFPEDYQQMVYWPYRLSPTCRIVTDSGTSFMGLSDSGSESENQGDIDRSLLIYAPDITFHMQEILKVDESLPDKASTKYMEAGNYDVWLLVMAKEKVTNVSATSEETQQMLDYYAYSSYYNDGLYGGYGGYGGYGYGGYGGYGYGYGYNNYYTYAMYAQQARMVQTSTSQSIKLDRDRFYCAALNGPQGGAQVPTLRLTFALPNEE
ncbi:MAG: DUF4270 domain-containing protein [Bacteroidales bacterium]|nr:DUF4270 domain-containing protein [Bacteroidales bacterium]